MAKKKETKKEEVKLKYAGVLLRPRVTEKASFLQEGNVYTFEVADKAAKKEIIKAIKEAYKVTPVRVNTVKNPSKQISMKGIRGFSGGVKKAYVYLKKGDKIEIK
jgi:large subunit ribosomal protein L23